MNAFKKSPVLNRECLRNKIEELSPLLLNHLNFHATWSYYASGCQERLTSIRRRIEQNAKIVVPKTQHRKNLNLSPTDSSLPPGVDLEDHIYDEFVSCFCSSDEGPAKTKKPPKRSTFQKAPNAVQYPSPKQWNSWKREEREVRRMLTQSFDPYRAEELTSKLQKLRKLTSRRPLVVLPTEPEISKKVASTKTKSRSPIKSQKQPEVIPKPGPYVNRPSTAPVKSTKSPAKAAKLRELSTKDTSEASSLTNLEIQHSSPEITSSSMMYDNISKRSDRDAPGLNFKVVILPEYPESDNEGPKKFKSSRKKSSKISQVSKLRKDSPAKVKNKKPKVKHVHPIDSLFIIPHKLQKEKKNSDASDSGFFLPQTEQEVPRSNLKFKFSEISYFSENSLNENSIKLNVKNQLKKPQNPNKKPALENSIKKKFENHDNKRLRKISNKKTDAKPARLEDSFKENRDNLNEEKLRQPFIQKPEKKPSISNDFIKENIKNSDEKKLRKSSIQKTDEKPAVQEDFVKENMENLDVKKGNPYEKPALPMDSFQENMEDLNDEKLRKAFNQKPDEKPAVQKDLVKKNMENLDVKKGNPYEKSALPMDSFQENMQDLDVIKLIKPFIQNPGEKPALLENFVEENKENLNVEKLRKSFIQKPDKKPAVQEDFVKKNMENLDVKKERKSLIQNPYEKLALFKDSFQENSEDLNLEKLRKMSIQKPNEKPVFLVESVNKNFENRDKEKPDEKPALLEDSVEENKENLNVEKPRKSFIQKPDKKPFISNDFMKVNIKNPDEKKLRKRFNQKTGEKPSVQEDVVKKKLKNLYVKKGRKSFIQNPYEKLALFKDSFQENSEDLNLEKLRKMSIQKPNKKPLFLVESVNKNFENRNKEKPNEKPALLEDSVEENKENLNVEKPRKSFIQKPDKKPSISNDFMKVNIKNPDEKKLRKSFIQKPDEKPAVQEDFVKKNMEYLDVKKGRKSFIQQPYEKLALFKDSFQENMEDLNLEKLRKASIQKPDEKPVFLEESVNKNVENRDKDKPDEKPALLENSVKTNIGNNAKEKLSNQKLHEKPAPLEDFIKENMEIIDVKELQKPFIQDPSEKHAISNDFIQEDIKKPGENPEEKSDLRKGSSEKMIKNPHGEKIGNMSETLQINPSYKPHKFNSKAHFWHFPNPRIPFKPKRNSLKPLSRHSSTEAKDRVCQRSFSTEIRKMESITKEQNQSKTHITFRDNRDSTKSATAPDGLPLDQEQATNNNIITKTKTETNRKSRIKYDWPLPFGLKHCEYFKPYAQLPGEQANQSQTFPEVLYKKRKSSVSVPGVRRLSLRKRKLSSVTSPEIRIPFWEKFKWKRKSGNLLSLSYEKTTPSSAVSNEDLKGPPPVIISDIIKECLKSYGSEISFKDTFTNFMKPNKLDYYSEIPIKECQPKMDEVKKTKPKTKKTKKKFSKKVLTKPSRREPPPCSLCNMVRRRQSELRPYMKRMQRQRQRLELKTYYTQKILMDRHSQAVRRACTREVLTRCYQTLKLCQELLELRLVRGSRGQP